MQLSHTVAGTDLLEHVIEHASDIAKTTYISFSDVALSKAESAATRGNHVLTRIGKGRIIPFTVPQAFVNPHYVERLCRENKVFQRQDRRYPMFRWWHTIRTYRIESTIN